MGHQQGGGRQCNGVHHQAKDDPGDLPPVGHADPRGDQRERHHATGVGQEQQPRGAAALTDEPTADDGGRAHVERAAEHDPANRQSRVEDGDMDGKPCHSHGAEADDDQGRHQHGTRTVAVDGPTHGWRRASGQQATDRGSATDERPAPSGFVSDEGDKDREGETAGRVADEHAAAGGSQHDPSVVERDAPGDVGDQGVHGGKALTREPVERGDGIVAKPHPRFQLFKRAADGEGL